jgi:hypothetical protein
MLLVYPNRNQIKNDALGAFMPEALAFRAYHAKANPSIRIDEFVFDPHNYSRSQFLEAVKGQSQILIFSHGLPTQLPQLHIGIPQIPEMLDALPQSVPILLCLYCCLTAKPIYANSKNRIPNFAETLTIAMRERKMEFDLYAHRTAGHTTANPNVTHYSEKSVYSYPECLKSYGTKFAKEMRQRNNPLRFVYPFEFAEPRL